MFNLGNKIYFLANTNTDRSATIIVAGTNSVKIPCKMLCITGATPSKTPTSTPKKETNTKIVPPVKKAPTSEVVIFNNPTTTPNRNTTHNKVL